MNFRDRWVLVTGASSGLGAEMARQLAREHGAHLVLVARRAERLEALAEEIRGMGRNAIVLAKDVGTLAGAEALFRASVEQVPLYAAILNAGTTHFGHHDELSWEAFESMLDLNVRSTARLLQLFLGYFEGRGGHGGVLVVASLAGLTPVSYQAAYSGTKGFLVNFACALHHEMRHRGVTVSVFAPGGIATEMTAGERFNDLRRWLVPVVPCAREALTGFKKRRYLTVPGIIYRFGGWFTRLLPASFVVGTVAKQYRHSLQKNVKG